MCADHFCISYTRCVECGWENGLWLSAYFSLCVIRALSLRERLEAKTQTESARSCGHLSHDCWERVPFLQYFLVCQMSMKTILAVLISGLCLGLSQPLVIEVLNGSNQILGMHGLLGLLNLIGYAPLIYLLPKASVGRAFKLA